MWQKKEFDRSLAGDVDESPKAKEARTVAEIFQHIREFSGFLKDIKALEAPIRTDDAEILLLLQATACEEALSPGAIPQLERAEAAINELLEAQAGLDERLGDLDWAVKGSRGGSVPVGKDSGEGKRARWPATGRTFAARQPRRPRGKGSPGTPWGNRVRLCVMPLSRGVELSRKT